MSVLNNFQFRPLDFDFSNLRIFIFGTSVKFNFGKFDRVDLHKNIADNVSGLCDGGAIEEQIKTKPEYNWKLEENWYRIMERD